MPKTYTRKGDNGYTGLLGDERVAKHHPRMEAIGNLDETTAAIGVARAHARASQTSVILMEVQRDLYLLMAEVSATPENAPRFRKIDETRIQWLENQTDTLSGMVLFPDEFILPGDTIPSAFLALARTITRRAERSVARLFHDGKVGNIHLLGYLNRLSSLLFVLELYENTISGQSHPSLAKGK